MASRNKAIPIRLGKWLETRGRWALSLGNLVAPPTCVGCRQLLPEGTCLHFCPTCRSRIVQDSALALCRRCGARFRSVNSPVDDCRFCRHLDIPFRSVTTLANYDGLLRDLVVRMKSAGGQQTAIQVGRWLAERLADHLSHHRLNRLDYVTPMPIHWTRRWRRGHNVAELLCEAICERTELQNKARRLLISQRKTRKQGTLTMRQRFVNVQGCFRVSARPAIESSSILLVDDVMTSGATAMQAAQQLLGAGAAEVHLAIVARGVGRHL